jgi:glc operon protein GlcG
MDKDTAKKAMAAAGVAAEKLGKPVCVAIVDITGAMVLFERFGNVPSYTAAIAEGKATGAAFTGRTSGQLEQMQSDGGPVYAAIAGQLTGRRFVPRQGAVPLTDSTGVIGAIGVSGATSQEDEDVAKAGAEAL